MKKNREAYVKLDPKEIRSIVLDSCKTLGERKDIVFKETKKIKTHLFRKSETIIVSKEIFVKDDYSGEWKEVSWFPVNKSKNIYSLLGPHGLDLGFFEITEDDKIYDVNVLETENFDTSRTRCFFRQSENELWEKAVQKVSEFLRTAEITWIEC